MFKYLAAPAALMLVMSSTGAKADVITQFNITEPFGGPFAFIEGGGNIDNAPEVDVGGNLMINVTTGQIVSSDVTATNVAEGSPSTFSTIHSVTADVSNTGIDVTLFDSLNLDEIVLDIPVTTFIGYAGGEIDGSQGSDTIVGNGSHDTPFYSLGAAQLVPVPNVSTTPVPAALPLFGTGLVFIGTLARRKKRKVVI